MKRPEQILQTQCVHWYRFQYPDRLKLLHSNNNNAKNRIIGAIWKGLGMCSGVSDLEYNRAGKTYFIEIKVPKGTQSKEQKEFQKQIENEGFVYVIIKDLNEFINFIKSIK